MNVNKNIVSSIPNNIYVNKKVLNNKKDYSETVKILNDEVIFGGKKEIDKGQLEEFVDEITVLDGVFEGETLFDQEQQSIDKFFVNLTNSYAKEKYKIESNFTGEEKEKQLEMLNKKFDNTVNKYSYLFEGKPPSSNDILNECGFDVPKGVIRPLDEIRESIKKLGAKAKEYIDAGNKAPTNMEEFEKFNEYISKNSTDEMDNLSLDTLSKFDKIATGMRNDNSSFEDFNSFVDKVDLPEGMKDILKLSSFSKIDIPHKNIWITSKNANEITQKANENKKYFESLLNSKTEKQKQAENNETVNKMLSMFNNINKNLFSSIKTGNEKYTDFIQQMKIKKMNNSLSN